jgi:alkylation response protein AidB-like acyl-CoA dehydrogenase
VSDVRADVQAELGAWVDEHWDPDLTLGEWWARLGGAGWSTPTWPLEWSGRALGRADAVAVVDELRRRGIPGGPTGVGVDMGGPTILARGNDEQRARYLADIACGRTAWCQLFSEPGAGSDLASLRTIAVRDGDGWRVTGQKVWSTLAHHADYGMLLARTDPSVPKHRGITWFVLAMDQPGVEVRPLRQMNGKAEFNEVFLDDAWVSDTDVVGAVNEGWGTALTTLGLERAASARIAGVGEPGRKAGWAGRRAGDYAASTRPEQPRKGSGGSRLIALARECGRTADPHVRQDLARAYTANQITRLNALRAKAEAAAGKVPGPSTRKILAYEAATHTAAAGLRILGADGMLAHRGDSSVDRAADDITDLFLFAPSIAIAGGTNEILRNVIAEKTLGLPREPDPERDAAFDTTHAGRASRAGHEPER